MSTNVWRSIALASAVGSLLASAPALASPAGAYDPVEPDGFPGDAAIWWAGPDVASSEMEDELYEVTAPDGNVPGSAESSLSFAQGGPTYDATDPDGKVPGPAESPAPLVLSGRISPGRTP